MKDKKLNKYLIYANFSITQNYDILFFNIFLDPTSKYIVTREALGERIKCTHIKAKTLLMLS